MFQTRFSLAIVSAIKASKLLCLTSSALALVACASSPKPAGPGGGMMDMPGGAAMAAGFVSTPMGLLIVGMDQNSDLDVQQEEFETAIEPLFQFADKDGDNRLIMSEFSDYLEKSMGNRSALPGRLYYDMNGDQIITFDEFSERMTEQFERLDQDENGVVTRNEVLVELPNFNEMREQMMDQMRSQMRQQRGRRPGGGGMPGGGMPGGGRPGG